MGSLAYRALRLCLPPLLLAALCLLAYTPFLRVPIFGDSYIQIQLGREFGAYEKWGDLLLDPLQRCRFTSILFTHWTEQWISIAPETLRLSSIGLHYLNALAVFSLGFWRPVGYRLSWVAACFFSVYQRPQEAVAWYAGISELLVFFFLLAAVAFWLRFLEDGRREGFWYACALAAFLLALLSKESAVAFVPIAVGLAIYSKREKVQAAIPFVVIAVVYFLGAWFAREGHAYVRDGSFSLQAPVLAVLARTTGRLLWVWGLISVAALLYWHRGKALPALGAVAAWIICTALPYAFLTGQDWLASRHVYLASVGIAFLVGKAMLELWDRRSGHLGEFAVVAAMCLLYQVGTLWTYRHGEMVERARPTRELLRTVNGYTGPVQLECFPGGPVVAEHVLAIETVGRVWLSEKTPERPARRFNGCRSGDAQAGGSGT